MRRPSGNPSRKLRYLKAAMRARNWELALRIAARFRHLGRHRAAIILAHEAYTNSRFYQQLGKDPQVLKEAGKRALISRYGRS